MHYHLEIIMPPTDSVKETIKNILAPFNEDPEEGEREIHAFWDWWVIGGRYSGQHIVSKYDHNKMDEFYKELKNNKITVSGLVFGKNELSPGSQIPFVDALWQTHFPEDDGPCPLFKHSNNQYEDNYSDVCQISNLPQHLSCSRIIITNSEFKPEFMIEDSYWNGVSWINSEWDGTVKKALKIYKEKTKHYRDEWRDKNAIQPNWLLVTVDYHS